MTTKTFTCTLAGAGPNRAFPYIEELPFDSVKVFGARGRVNVKVTIHGTTIDTSLTPMGGKHVLAFSGPLAKKAGIAVGDRVKVTIAKDDAPRTVETPPALAKALAKNAKAKAAWDKLAPSHKKEHARAIDEAKKDETRTKRIEKTIEMLVTKGRPTPPKPSNKPLAERLGIKKGQTFEVRDRPRGFDLVAPTGKGAADVVFVFTKNRAAVDALAKRLPKDDTALWIAYPKMTSGIDTDLNRDKGWDSIEKQGWHPVRQVAVDDVWSALRFKRS